MSFTFNKKNVLILLKVGGLGGAERQALNLAQYLIENKNCTVYLNVLSSKPFTNEFTGLLEKTKVILLPSTNRTYLSLKFELSYKNLKRLKWSFTYLYSFRKLLINHNIEVVIPYLVKPSVVALLATYKTKIITFWHHRGQDNYKYELLQVLAKKRCKLFISNQPDAKIELNKKLGNIKEGKIKVLLQPFYKLPKEHESNEKLLKILKKDNHQVITMVSHFREGKRQDLLIRAFDRLKKTECCKLILVGNIKNNNYFNTCIKPLISNNKNIIVLSEIPLSQVLPMTDIAVLISDLEGYPNVLLEYASYKLPIIATTLPASKNFLGVDNVFLAENQVDEIKRLLVKLIKSPELRLKEGLKTYRQLENHKPSQYVTQLEELLNKLLPNG